MTLKQRVASLVTNAQLALHGDQSRWHDVPKTTPRRSANTVTLAQKNYEEKEVALESFPSLNLPCQALWEVFCCRPLPLGDITLPTEVTGKGWGASTPNAGTESVPPVKEGMTKTEQTALYRSFQKHYTHQQNIREFIPWVMYCPARNALHNLLLGNYSEGQRHVIQQNNSQELISPNMSSQLQLGNSPDLIFISTGRCQLDDFRGSPPGFCCGVSLNFLALRSQLKFLRINF